MSITHIIKNQFPIFSSQPHLIYLDSTATALKPFRVIDKINEYYKEYSANIFRGVYDISERATLEYEETRNVVAKFINAADESEVIFTSGTTESINMFAQGVEHMILPGDEVVVTVAEHHSNFVPWQQLTQKLHARFTVITDDLSLTKNNITSHINKNTKVLAITHVSNVLGTVNPIKAIVTEARKINPNIIILVDAAQSAPHIRIDVQDLGCDGLAFSSHKLCGPTGVGVLWVKKTLLEQLTPYQYGGEMIRSVSIVKTEFASIPHRFEAGTPHIAGVIAFKEAISFLNEVGLDAIADHEQKLAQYCYDELKREFGDTITLVGPSRRQSGIVAFEMHDVHAHDTAQILNEHNIAVRAGHHCAMPLHTHLGLQATVRASFYLYNTKTDIEKLLVALTKVQEIFQTKN